MSTGRCIIVVLSCSNCSSIAGACVPPGSGLFLLVPPLYGHVGRTPREKDPTTSRLDHLLPPLSLSGGRDGALHGRLLLGKFFRVTSNDIN